MATALRRVILAVFLLAFAVEARQQHHPPSGWSELNSSVQKMHTTMASIKPSGNDDADFVRLMLPHHQAAIEMAKSQLLHGKDPQLNRLAQEIITDQQSEIELMQLWLQQHESTPPATK